jgi:hypothetical protein
MSLDVIAPAGSWRDPHLASQPCGQPVTEYLSARLPSSDLAQVAAHWFRLTSRPHLAGFFPLSLACGPRR